MLNPEDFNKSPPPPEIPVIPKPKEPDIIPLSLIEALAALRGFVSKGLVTFCHKMSATLTVWPVTVSVSFSVPRNVPNVFLTPDLS